MNKLFFFANAQETVVYKSGTEGHKIYRILGYYGSQFNQFGTTFATSLKIDF